MVSYLFVLYQHPLADITLFEVTTLTQCYLLIFLPPGDHTTILKHITPDAFLLERNHSAPSVPPIPSPLHEFSLSNSQATTFTAPVFFFSSTYYASSFEADDPETDEARLLASVQGIIFSLTHDAYWSLTPPYHIRAVEYAQLFPTQYGGVLG
jgi:hypothetical protein